MLDAEPVVFLGPSLPVATARTILGNAEYRPPIRRGDLDTVPAGRVVGIVDGVFDQALAVSPREVASALDRGVVIVGSSSMGALRAAEVTGVVGVGKVYEMYRDGSIDRDDEVALLFDPDTLRPITEPLVNVRWAVQRLIEQGSIEAELGQRILAAARRLHYRDRSWRRIVVEAGLGDRADVDALVGCLRSFDLKRDDAQLLLERLRDVAPRPRGADAIAVAAPESGPEVVPALGAVDDDAPILLWELGDRVGIAELIRFLVATGRIEHHARAAVLRFLADGGELAAEVQPDEDTVRARASGVLGSIRTAWGWSTHEEAVTTLVDLGVDVDALAEHVAEEATVAETVAAVVRDRAPALLSALRSQLVLDDLALKREVIRVGSITRLAAAGRARGGRLASGALAAARDALMAAADVHDPEVYLAELARFGVTSAELDALVEDLAWARHATRELVAAMAAPRTRPRRGRAPTWAWRTLVFGASPKAPGSSRFCCDVPTAERVARRLAPVIGVTRVGMIGELGDLGVHVSQVFRPDGRWSSTIGSGKARTRGLARVGGVMEEVEKWAQERYAPVDDVTATYAAIARRGPAVDPAELDLPWDTSYRPDRALRWTQAFDLIRGEPVWTPLATLSPDRHADDPFYSPRAGRKIFATSGLASGMTLEEATVHALGEIIERHSTWIAELQTENPGGLGPGRFPDVDLATLPPALSQLLDKMRGGVERVRITEYTGELQVPTFRALLCRPDDGTRSPRLAQGYGTHPDPAVAIEMAVLEAAQTVLGNIAGAREDLAIKTRSLGRHERSRPASRTRNRVWFGRVRPTVRFADLGGLVTDDAFIELGWMVERCAAAGVGRVLVVDLGRPELAPARVVRVVVPGLESTNPFHTGPRCRAVALHDLLGWP